MNDWLGTEGESIVGTLLHSQLSNTSSWIQLKSMWHSVAWCSLMKTGTMFQPIFASKATLLFSWASFWNHQGGCRCLIVVLWEIWRICRSCNVGKRSAGNMKWSAVCNENQKSWTSHWWTSRLIVLLYCCSLKFYESMEAPNLEARPWDRVASRVEQAAEEHICLMAQ